MADDNDKTIIAISDDTDDKLIGLQLNGMYEIDRHIATGGMGEVYRGHNIQTDDPVAIKIVLPEFARDETIHSLFVKEAKTLGRLAHDAIVRYHVFSKDPVIDRLYLAMEYADGESLIDHAKMAPLTPEEVRQLLIRLSSGLAAAHDAEIIHRDLSPDNVILPEGDVTKAKIIDFGIAKSNVAGSRTLIGGKFAGKYNFVSPEQLGLFNGDITGRSDIYSLALVGITALLGKPLDMAGSQLDVIEKRQKLPDLSMLDERLQHVFEAMLQPDPKDRPESMQVIAQYLERFGEVSGEALPPPGWRGDGGRDAGQSGVGDDSREPGSGSFTSSVEVSSPEPAPLPETTNVTGAPTASSLPDGALKSAGPLSLKPESLPPTSLIPQNSSSRSASPLSAPPVSTPPQSPPSESPVTGSLQQGSQTPQEISVESHTPSVIIDQDTTSAQTSVPPDAGGKSESPFGPYTGPEPDTILPPPAEIDSRTGKSKLPLIAVLVILIGGGIAVASFTGVIDVFFKSTDIVAEEEKPTPDDTTIETSTPSTEPGDTAVDETEQQETETAALPSENTISVPPNVSIVSERIAWIEQYQGGECFFVAPTSVSGETVEIEGFGAEVSPFRKLESDFDTAYGITPDIGVRLVENEQCAVVDFLNYLRGSSDERPPKLTLNKDIIESGDSIRGKLTEVSRHIIDLLIIDNEGVVYNIGALLRRSGDNASFNILLNLKTENPVPQMIVAIATRDGLKSTKLKKQQTVGKVFSAIRNELETKNIAAGAKAVYFKIGG